jgi:O-acetyl-ADP-ribose deacetylase (regulator of RNase III)
MSGGVSQDLNRESGGVLRDEVRKHQLPVPLGSVVVTGAGQLHSKYVFHATTIDFLTKPSSASLIAQLVRQILEIGSALRLEHVAMPLLGGGRARLPQSEVFKYLVNSVFYFTTTEEYSVRKITIILWQSDDIQSVLPEMAERISRAVSMQQRIRRLQELYEEAEGDSDFRAILNDRANKAKQELCQLFYFPEIADNIADQQGTTIDLEGYREAMNRLEQNNRTLQEEWQHLEQIQEIEERRKRYLEKRAAEVGVDVPPDVSMEIEDIQKRMEQRQQKMQQNKNQQLVYLRELKELQRRDRGVSS